MIFVLHRISPKARTAVIIVSSLIGLVVVGGGLLWATLVIGLSGGWGQWQLSRQAAPNFANPAITESRDQAQQTFVTDLKQIVPTSYQNYGQNTTDHCDKGQHSFAVHDSYAYGCAAQVTRYYGFDGDFRQTLLDLDTSLRAQGWATKAGADTTIKNFYDKNYTGPGTSYTAVNLPGALYTKNGVTLEMSWVERGDTDLQLFENNLNQYFGTGVYQKDSKVDITTVTHDLFAAHRYGVSIAVSKDYYLK